MRGLIEKHKNSYREYVADAILGVESISMARLYGWESEILHAKSQNRDLHDLSDKLIECPTYGDGGMAAAVRIASAYQ